MNAWGTPASLASNEAYHLRISQALAFMESHLDEPLDLERTAQAASFSPFHFHRIFTALTGETPNEYLSRIRLERAANWLIKKPALSVTEIALGCGFSSPAVFARLFKQRFGVPATLYRREQSGRFVQTLGEPPGALPGVSRPLDEQRARQLVSDVQVRRLPALGVAFISNFKGYDLEKICAAWERLFRWAQAKDLLAPETRMVGVSYDDPFITAGGKCRYDACITLAQKPPASEPVGYRVLKAGRYAVARLGCFAAEIQLAYHALYGLWLPHSGFMPGDAPVYELYLQTPEQNPEGKFLLEICLPLAE